MHATVCDGKIIDIIKQEEGWVKGCGRLIEDNKTINTRPIGVAVVGRLIGVQLHKKVPGLPHVRKWAGGN